MTDVDALLFLDQVFCDCACVSAALAFAYVIIARWLRCGISLCIPRYDDDR